MSAPSGLSPFDSPLGWAVPATVSGRMSTEASTRWVGAMVRAALALGLSTFHAGSGPASLVRAHGIVAAIRELRGTRVSVIVGLPLEVASSVRFEPAPVEPPMTQPPSGPATEVAWHLELDPAQVEGSGPASIVREFSERSRENRILSWGVGYVQTVPSPEEVRRVAAFHPGWVRLPFHLLSPPTVRASVAEAHRLGLAVLADDPFAGGALNGRLLREGSVARGAPSRPPDLASLRSEWGPVVSLGFLTSDGRRTLGEAALQFVLGTPGVVGALIDAPDAAELAELGRLPTLPPLEEDERRRVEARMSGTDRRSRVDAGGRARIEGVK